MSMRAQAEPSGQGDEPEEVGTGDLPDRRRFVRTLALGGAAVAAGAAAIPAMAGVAAAQTSTTVAGPPTIPAGDVTLVNFALGLELAAAQLYGDMIATGKLTSAVAGQRPDLPEPPQRPRRRADHPQRRRGRVHPQRQAPQPGGRADRIGRPPRTTWSRSPSTWSRRWRPPTST